MIPLIRNFETLILADGAFPSHPLPLSLFDKVKRIVCCDGATAKLLSYGKKPDYIVGDMDTLSKKLQQEYAAIIYKNPDQETNDLTKAVHFCLERGWQGITILGASGNREDHLLGNLSLLLEYAPLTEVQLLTDSGIFTPQLQSTEYESYPEQQVSIFSLTPDSEITSIGLCYPLDKRKFTSWWQGTLNESESNSFRLDLTSGKLLVFREY